MRIERLRETLEVIRKLWTEDPVSYAGAHFRIKDATLEPKPLQKPRPPIWIGGNSSKIMRIVAEIGDGWIPVLPTPGQLAAGASRIKEGMRQLGRNPDRLRVACGGRSIDRPFHVHGRFTFQIPERPLKERGSLLPVKSRFRLE